MRIFKILVGILFCSAAWADTASITFTPPTTYVDGSGLPASAITGYEFRCGVGTTVGVVCTPLSLPGTATGGVMVVTGPSSGFTACPEGRTLTAGAASVYSVPVCKTFPALVPNPPGNVTVAVVIGLNMTPVFKLTATGKRSSEAAGFVSVGAPCTGNVLFYYRDRGYRRIDHNAVAWWNVVPSQNVAAPCA